MGHRKLLTLILNLFILLGLLVISVSAETPRRDTRSWTDPSGSGLTITFSTPDFYNDCETTFDRIWTTGMPANWRLRGYVKVQYNVPTVQVVNRYDIDQLGDLNLTVTYPPSWQWPVVTPSTGLREIHIDLAIAVLDENGVKVPWVSFNGVLGPGQDWDVTCAGPFLGDTVWDDLNANGIQEASEPGIPNVTVNLYDCFGNYVKSMQTGLSGFYTFSNLRAGTPGYIVEFIPPPGYTFSPPLQGTDPQIDSNADPVTGKSSCVILGPSEYNKTIDAGLYRKLSLGDRVWFDQNQDGIQGLFEPGYNGATVQLFDNATCTGSSIASTTSAAGPAGFGDGFYQFTNLNPGTYSVKFSGLPAGWSFSTPNQGGDDTKDSDADPATGCITNINLTANDPDEDAGIYIPGSLGDQVWCESATNPNTTYDPADGDFGIPNVGVVLYEDFNCDGAADGAAIASLDTNSTGFYTFSGLEVSLFGDPNNQTCYVVAVDQTDPDLGACNNPITPTQTNPQLDSNTPTDLDNDFGFEQAGACNLFVDKKCTVSVPPSQLACTDTIVATTLRYTGPSIANASVSFQSASGAMATYNGIDLVQGVTVLQLPAQSGFSIDSRATGKNDLGSKTTISINGTSEVIHTSCSTPYLAGQPAPLDNPKGNPSPNWFVENFVDKDSSDVVALPPPSDNCTATLGPNPSCATLGKPTSLTFRYTGGGCTASNNSQRGKATCSGGVDPGLPVMVTSSNSGYTITPSQVNPGEEFTVSASSFNSDSFLTLSNAGGTEQLKIHTSCSQVFEVGNIFGSLTLSGFNGQRDGVEVTYTYEVTNLGDDLFNLFLDDNPLGPVASGFNLPAGQSVSFSKTAVINATTTNIADVFGQLANGTTCPAPSDTTTVTLVEPCAVCKGGVTELTFQYQGISSGNIVVYDKDSADPNKILFQGLLNPGDQFTIVPRTGQSNLSSDISIYVNGQFHVKIHTSCSQPIGPNAVYGNFKVTEGRSKDNGLMCPLDVCDPTPAPSLEFSGNEIYWDVTNNGDFPLEIKRVTISWPNSNGYLDEIKREGDVYHKGNFTPGVAVIDSGWEGNPDKRTIDVGNTDTLKFKFQNAASLDGAYDLTIEFAAGCSIHISYTPPVSGGNFSCSKPIDSLTMIWDGNAPSVWVTAWKGSVGSTALATLAPVALGSEITVSGYAGSPNDVIWEIFANASGSTKLGESTFHLSCSDSDMNDALDCGKLQGDGKGQSGYINAWRLEGLVDSDETLNCTAP